MAQSLRHIKSRIRSIENTRKLTRAMEMISISKLRRSQEALAGANGYYARIESLLMKLLPGEGPFDHPLFKGGAPQGRVGVCVVTSDTGLCSAYNHSLIYVAQDFLRAYDRQKVMVVTVGKKEFLHFTREGYRVAHSYTGLNGRFSDEVSSRLLKDLTALFVSGQAKEVYTVSMQPKDQAHYKPMVQKFLSIECARHETAEYIVEPERQGILDELIPEYLSSKMRMVLMHAFAAEHQARATSMGEATHNATELLEALVLTRNKIRQANITREIIEIISSAGALKG